MKTNYLLFLLSLSMLFTTCKKEDPVMEEDQVISAKVNGINFFMVRNIIVEYKNNTLKIQGNDFVDNYLEFTVTEIMKPGVHEIPTAKFQYIEDPSIEYIAEQNVGIMTISELTLTKLVGTFTMTLNNEDNELVEVTQGRVDLKL